MRSKIVLIIMSMVITISAMAGATFAWFVDSETNSGNTFTTGTVEIKAVRSLGDPNPGPMFYVTKAEGATPSGKLGGNETGLWYPGLTIQRALNVKNLGSLDVRLNQVGAQIISINGGSLESDAALADSFEQNMNIRIYDSFRPSSPLFVGTLKTLLSTATCDYKPILAAFTPGEEAPNVTLCYEVTMDENAGNDLQGVDAVLSFWVGAEQTANNPLPVP